MPRFLSSEELKEEKEIREELKKLKGETSYTKNCHDYLTERLYELWNKERERERRIRFEIQSKNIWEKVLST